MNALTIFATIFCATAVLLPGLAELFRIQSDRNNPTRLLRVQTRRLQPASPSVSFVGRR
jgi:hypothetical protein